MSTNRPISYNKVLSEANSNNRLVRKTNAFLGYIQYSIEYLRWKWHLTFTKSKKIDFFKIKDDSIPILLNNFNRLEPLKELISWLMSLETPVSIIIIDNKSTFPPLLNFYNSLENNFIQIIHMEFNSGRFGLIHYFSKLKRYNKIVISDCDLIPYNDTPKDILAHFSTLLDKYPKYNHIGVSLEIHDIPDTYPLKDLVLSWEKKFWPPLAKEIYAEVYEAEIDTTFSMWRSNSIISPLAPALRTKAPYRLKHVDWYVNPNNIDQEYEYYISTCSSFGSWTKELVRWKSKPERNGDHISKDQDRQMKLKKT